MRRYDTTHKGAARAQYNDPAYVAYCRLDTVELVECIERRGGNYANELERRASHLLARWRRGAISPVAMLELARDYFVSDEEEEPLSTRKAVNMLRAEVAIRLNKGEAQALHRAIPVYDEHRVIYGITRHMICQRTMYRLAWYRERGRYSIRPGIDLFLELGRGPFPPGPAPIGGALPALCARRGAALLKHWNGRVPAAAIAGASFGIMWKCKNLHAVLSAARLLGICPDTQVDADGPSLAQRYQVQVLASGYGARFELTTDRPGDDPGRADDIHRP